MQTQYSLEEQLALAVFLSDADDVRALLDEGADPDARDTEQRTVLMNAVADGQNEMVRMMLERGADPNLRDADGLCPLDVAVYRRQLDIAWLLIQYGADVNARDDLGISVLMRAALASGGSTDILDLLRRRGVRSEAADTVLAGLSDMNRYTGLRSRSHQA